MTRRVMVDLETLGTTPGCVILSIGAVAFNEETGQFGEDFYITVSRGSCRDFGLTEDPDTVAWWANQSKEARRVVLEAESNTAPSLPTALKAFASFVGENAEVWGNGADFDNAILIAAYKAAGMPVPWKFYNSRCYRTLKNLFPKVPFVRSGTHHNALDDARTQAIHAIDLLRHMESLVNTQYELEKAKETIQYLANEHA